MRRSLTRTLTAVLALLVMLVQGTWVLAGTTGTLNGTVNDAQTGAALSGARVTVSSPSQQATSTTDAQGRFSFLSLAPDTYTLTIAASGYQPVTQSGVTVQADNVQSLSFRAPKQLQRIGGTTARASTDLVKPGTTSDVYSINATQASAAAGLGGGGGLNTAYSAIASVPGVFVPIGQQGWAQSVYIRGGNYTQLGYEYDGVPVQRAYDSYPSSTLSALGQQELQVYTGSQPGSAQSSGLAGFVNQVIKTGTYPGTATGELSVGAPSFYHKAQVEFGGASPDRNFSYYLGAAGYNQDPRYVDQFDGETARYNYSSLAYASISKNCGTPQATAGCYSNSFGSAPNGYLYLPLSFGSESLSDHEVVGNFHLGIPHKKDGLRDDIQALTQISFLSEGFKDSYSALSPGITSFIQNGAATYQGQTYPSCTAPLLASNVACVNSMVPGSQFRYNDRSIYTGPTGGALTAGNLGQVGAYPFPAQPGGLANHGFVAPNANGTEQINDSIFKLQYTHAMGANAFLRVYGYSLYSDWLNNDPNSSSNPGLAFVPADYILPTHTRGIGLALTNQVGSHLLSLTGGYSYANLSRWNNSFPSTGNPVAVLVDSTNPTGGCYSAAFASVYCGSSKAARYMIPGTNKSPSIGLQGSSSTVTVANAASFTCGNGPCEYLAVGSGLNGSFNNVTPRFSNLTLSDSWNVNQALALDLAVRYDSFRYDIPSATSPGGPNPAGTASAVGRSLFTNSYNQWNCYNASTLQIVAATGANTCPAGSSPVAFSNANPTSLWYGGFQPRLGASYKLDPNNVIRAGYGRYLQPSSTAYTFYNRAGADIASYDVPKFYAYGFTSAAHSIPPAESWNLDFSWEHQVKGSDLTWKVSPFFRRTRNEDINVVLDPVTNFVSSIPALSSNVRGVELLLRKGDFARNGFAGQLSYTYTYETSRYQTLPGGSTALDNVNSSIRQYNAYTSFCATHPSDSRCGTTTTGTTAAPCYANDGTPVPSCGASSIANPYWNAPVQQLFDPKAEYFPYNQTFGTGFASNASSYNLPHVAALILNYKHNKWAFTPSIQFTAGGRYGSPVMGIAMDPAAGGCAPLAGTTANDPRYPYGAAGGAPYDAQGCTGYVTGPDPYTGKFDKPGQFVEPSQLVANLGISYEASKRVKLSVLAVNLYGSCFGGTQAAWTGAGPKIGCWYGSATGFQAGNFYNPGNAFQVQSYPYSPVLGGIAGQQAYGTAVNPLQIYFSAQIKM